MDKISKILPEPGPWHHEYAPAAWLCVRGEDAFSFLQGQFTQDLRSSKPQPARYGLWLNQKGRVLADSFSLCISLKEIWLHSYFSPAATIRERLESYIVADDVTIEDHTAEGRALTLGGGAAAALMGTAAVALPAPGEFARIGEGFIFGGRRGGAETWEWVGLGMRPPAGGLDVSTEEMLRLRLEAGVPAVPVDLGPGDLPNEGGLEDVAISYTKGCYLGQEVMARLRSMGRVRRRLRRVRGPGLPPPERPAPLFQGGKRIGELRSAVADGARGWAGLAMLGLTGLGPAEPLGLAPEGGAEIQIVDTV